jgi:hypothetical protein
MFRWLLLVVGASLTLTACTFWRDTYTLSPAVKESARRYSDVMDDFADQALLANVMRAREFAPLNFNDLSAITGSLSMSGTLGLTLPFGHYVGNPNASTLLGYKDTASPSFTGSTSPVITLGTLNTQGFMLTMIQPISTTYILSKWDSYPHELLLLLFIKSIRFPGETDNLADTSHRRAYRNDPDSENEFRDFQQLIEKMMASGQEADSGKTVQVGNVDMKSLMILDPLGNPVPAGKLLTATTPIPSQTLSVTAPGAPKIAGSSSGSPPAGTYYAQVTYVTSLGETLPSPETAPYQVPTSGLAGLTISLAQSSPPQGGPNVTGYNVYVATSPGNETRQNQVPLTLGAVWTLPNTGLVAGGLPPGKENGRYATTLPVAPGTQYAVQGDYAIFQTINGLTDGQLHAGNSGCPDYVHSTTRLDPVDLCPAGSPAPFVQFYKEYPAQIVLCLDVPDDGLFFDHHIYASSEQAQEQAQQALAKLPAAQHRLDSARVSLTNVLSEAIRTEGESREAKARHAAQQEAATQELNSAQKYVNHLNSIIQWPQEKAARAEFSVANMAKGMGPPATSAPTPTSGGSPGGGSPGGGGGNNGSTSTTPGGMGQVTLALQPSRISAIVPSAMCKGDQFVLHQESEEDFDQESQKFTHIEWRSIAEVIQYLGALARYQDRHGTNPVGWADGSGTHRIFTYARGTDGRIAVDYLGGAYTVPLDYKKPSAGVVDHSLQTLAVLNELISIAKISGGLPVPQPVQVLP